jgi:hypothetical protein
MRLINHFRECGSAADRKRFRRPTTSTEAKLDDVEGTMQRSPSKSLRRLRAQGGISYESAQKATRELLQLRAYHFCCVQEHLISKGLWPPRSADLSLPDFFLWGYLKGNVYKNNPHTLVELKNNITMATTSISVQVLHKVASNMVKRACACITEQGAYFEHML